MSRPSAPPLLTLARTYGLKTHTRNVTVLAADLGQTLSRQHRLTVKLTPRRQGQTLDVCVHARDGRWLWSAYDADPDPAVITEALEEALTVQARLLDVTNEDEDRHAAVRHPQQSRNSAA